MNLKTLSILSVFIVGIAPAQTVDVYDLASLQSCINVSGASPSNPGICRLASDNSPYWVHSTLTIGGSNVTIQGNITSGRSSVTLRRAQADLYNIIWVPNSVTSVNIQDVTIDGNRFGTDENGNSLNIGCLPANGNYTDVDLISAYSGNISVDIISSPGGALGVSYAGYPSVYTVSSTNIIGARDTGIWLGQGGTCDSTSCSGVWNSYIAQSGTAAVTVDGTNQYVYNNILAENRYEVSDSAGGGGEIITENESLSAKIARNYINGNYWITTSFAPETWLSGSFGCPTTAGLVSGGIEAYGTNNGYYNNAIIQHRGSGIQVGGSHPTTGLIFSGSNPWVSGDAHQYIDSNAGGITVLGPPTWPNTSFNMTFDGIRITNSFHTQGDEGWGVNMSGVSSPTFTCSAGTGCAADVYMCGNANTSPPTPALNISVVYKSGTGPYPTSNEYTSGTCHTGAN
jgi:hypothetical protein